MPEVTDILSFDRHNNYSGTQQNFTCKVGSAQKRKTHVELERLHLQYFFHTNHLLNVSLKRKTDNIFIIIRRIMTTDKRAIAVGIHLALFSLRTESDNPDTTCELSP